MNQDFLASFVLPFFLFYVQLRPLREALSDAQIDRERMTDQLERLLSANKELQDNMEVLQTELGRKQVDYNNLLEERYDFLDHCTFLGNCPPTPPLSQHFAVREKYVLMLAYLICTTFRKARTFCFSNSGHVQTNPSIFETAYPFTRICLLSTRNQWVCSL